MVKKNFCKYLLAAMALCLSLCLMGCSSGNTGNATDASNNASNNTASNAPSNTASNAASNADSSSAANSATTTTTTTTTATTTITATVTSTDQFGDAALSITVEDFLAQGFTLGSSVNVAFSGGCKLESVPVYDNYYGDSGDIIVSCYHKELEFAGINCKFDEVAGVAEGETVTISLDSKDEYAHKMELYELPDPHLRLDFQTDEQFANERMIKAGDIKESRLFRSASPFDPKYNRCQIISDFIDDNGIRLVLDLADNEQSIQAFGQLTATAQRLVDGGQVAYEKMGADYASQATLDVIRNIFTRIGSEDGPYLVHCSLGQDRTGFVCCLIEAFCGASYDQIVDDYMLSYQGLYGFDRSSNPEKYQLFEKRIEEMLTVFTGCDNPSSLTTSQIKAAAWDYCTKAGLTEDELNRAYAALCEG